MAANRDPNYRVLKHGEAFFPGDEYFLDGKWKVLTTDEYEEWKTFRAHYYEDEGMCPFRRRISSPS
jgi:hypothetical protein